MSRYRELCFSQHEGYNAVREALSEHQAFAKKVINGLVESAEIPKGKWSYVPRHSRQRRAETSIEEASVLTPEGLTVGVQIIFQMSEELPKQPVNFEFQVTQSDDGWAISVNGGPEAPLTAPEEFDAFYGAFFDDVESFLRIGHLAYLDSPPGTPIAFIGEE